MSYAITIFKNIKDNKTHKNMSFKSFDAFADLLYKLHEKPGYKPPKGEFSKNSSPLISPAKFLKGELRRNVNVVEWSNWAALDIDDYDGKFEDAIERFKKYRFICYSSASSTKEHPKCRIVFDLTCPIQQKKIRHFWFALNHKFGELGDTQCKDLCRMYYVPAQYPNAYNFIFKNEGEILNPFEIMDEFEYIEGFRNSFSDNLPIKIKDQMEKLKKEKLTNYDITWSSYSNCPFVNKKMLAEYQTISGTGWYHKYYCLMVSIASRAIKMKYPISPTQIAQLCSEIDIATGGFQRARYGNRPYEVEASRAIDFALRNSASGDFIDD